MLAVRIKARGTCMTWRKDVKGVFSLQKENSGFFYKIESTMDTGFLFLCLQMLQVAPPLPPAALL